MYIPLHPDIPWVSWISCRSQPREALNVSLFDSLFLRIIADRRRHSTIQCHIVSSAGLRCRGTGYSRLSEGSENSIELIGNSRMAVRGPPRSLPASRNVDLLKLQDFQREQYGFLVSRASLRSARKNKCRFRKPAAHRVPDKRACNRSASRCTHPPTIRAREKESREGERERERMRIREWKRDA